MEKEMKTVNDENVTMTNETTAPETTTPKAKVTKKVPNSKVEFTTTVRKGFKVSGKRGRPALAVGRELLRGAVKGVVANSKAEYLAVVAARIGEKLGIAPPCSLAVYKLIKSYGVGYANVPDGRGKKK